ncbi:bifunctional tetrahydrofolate synthase/dihydrofolate synthase [Oceaniserpentilla sp. 4NH20-0058]|uniref:bifunctional tetrahydrofolate synthase/dihydrofolate synthase n=1 Tax=Oceaniserpentilla sp. 4NH20-0058 TaxID=3127660 RepID=UPI00310204FC
MKQNLDQWLSYLESNHPTEIDMGLERVRIVAQRLDLFKPTPLVLLVAGTNGKGSTVTFCTEFLKTLGLNVGSYMSPHLHVYNERVRINGQPVSDELIIESFEAIEIARQEISLTYFEVGTLSALYIFKQQKLDACVLEIGLGGRLDAVNIVDADGAAVTSIGLDHQDWLGSDLNQISYEKAGVFRANKAAVCGQRLPPELLIEHANDISANLFVKGEAFDFDCKDNLWTWRGLDTLNRPVVFEGLPYPSLPIENAATAIQLMVQVKPELTYDQVKKGLLSAQLDGRLQVFTHPFNGVMDVGHNPQAAQLLNQYLIRTPAKGRKIALLAMLHDKDAPLVVKEMTQIDEWHLAGLSGYRGQTSEELRKKLPKTMVVEHCHQSVRDALDALIDIVNPDDTVVVFGSFFTVAQLQDWLSSH